MTAFGDPTDGMCLDRSFQICSNLSMVRTDTFDQCPALGPAMELSWKPGYRPTSIQDLVEQLEMKPPEAVRIGGGSVNFFS